MDSFNDSVAFGIPNGSTRDWFDSTALHILEILCL
jgi:hypothetical protein